MRIAFFAAACAALSLTAPASAQNYQFNSVTSVARDVYSTCVEVSRKNGSLDAAEACACVTGYMAGAMSDRDYEVASVLLKIGDMAESGASQSEIQAEIIAFFERGFTEADVNRVAATIQAIGSRGDAVCAQFEHRGDV